MAISLVLVDDHPLLLQGLVQLLGLDAEFVVLATCSTPAEALDRCATLRPDVLILDLQLREGDGFTVLRELGQKDAPAVIVLTATENEDDLLEVVRLGARGVLLKAMAPHALEECIRVVHAGGTWLTVEGLDLGARQARRQAVERRIASRLTPRELEVLRMLASEQENEEIARRLGLSTGTAKLHVHHVYAKLGVSGRQELLLYLKREGY
jgi:DNA-binding NarL/FixJ family response regulator